jgi:hypothetical protein
MPRDFIAKGDLKRLRQTAMHRLDEGIDMIVAEISDFELGNQLTTD